jgi:hypothetical protein
MYCQTFSCPSGTEDMLNYFVMGYPSRVDHYMGPGNANAVYSYMNPDDGSAFATSGYFVWMKGSGGFPWDVKAFDSNYIYDRTTEYNWNDPYSFRRWNIDLPLSRRCVPIKKNGDDLRIAASDTNYSFYLSCALQQTNNLGYILNSITKPVSVNTNGNLGIVRTRYFKYRYGCNSSYASCSDMEVFSLGYQVGLYDWKHYVNQNGNFVLVQDAVINSFDVGQTTPDLPCSNSYQ